MNNTFSYNVTTKGLTAMSSFGNWSSVIAVLVLATIVLGVVYALSSNESFKKYYKLLKRIQASLTLFVYGLGGYAIIASFYGVYLLINADVSTGGIGFIAIIGIIGFYAITCGLGVLVKKLIKIIKKRMDSIQEKPTNPNKVWR